MVDLPQVIHDYPECLGNPDRLRAYLIDLYPQLNAKNEIHILVDLFAGGIAERIRMAECADNDLFETIIEDINADYRGSEQLLASCVRQWLLARDVITDSLSLQDPERAFPRTAVQESQRLAAGSTIEFGHFIRESDSRTVPLVWEVLEMKEEKSLILSRYTLDPKPYHAVFERITWSECSLRTWLNTEFFLRVFEQDERNAILDASVPSEANDRYQTASGRSTADKVFLLSISEVEYYLPSRKGRRKKPLSFGTPPEAAEDNSSMLREAWWLRSPGNSLFSAAYVGKDGSVFKCGNTVDSDRISVCPAMWIDTARLVGV